jgi:hypothetical protein
MELRFCSSPLNEEIRVMKVMGATCFQKKEGEVLCRKIIDADLR